MTLTIKVLGPGCANCHRVEERAVEALEALAEEDSSLEATIQHVTDPDEIMEYPIMFTPGLVINENLVCAGRIPTVEEVIGWMREVLADGEGQS
jgi:small redox-active disulfide protein 2